MAWYRCAIVQDRREQGNQKYEIIIPRVTKFHLVGHDHGLNWVGMWLRTSGSINAVSIPPSCTFIHSYASRVTDTHSLQYTAGDGRIPQNTPVPSNRLSNRLTSLIKDITKEYTNCKNHTYTQTHTRLCTHPVIQLQQSSVYFQSKGQGQGGAACGSNGPDPEQPIS